MGKLDDENNSVTMNRWSEDVISTVALPKSGTLLSPGKILNIASSGANSKWKTFQMNMIFYEKYDDKIAD